MAIKIMKVEMGYEVRVSVLSHESIMLGGQNTPSAVAASIERRLLQEVLSNGNEFEKEIRDLRHLSGVFAEPKGGPDSGDGAAGGEER